MTDGPDETIIETSTTIPREEAAKLLGPGIMQAMGPRGVRITTYTRAPADAAPKLETE